MSDAPASSPPNVAATPSTASPLNTWRQYIIYVGFVAIFLIFAATLNQKGFLSPNNLLNIGRQTAMIAIMAVAMTFVLSAGEIDLSIGMVAGLASMTTAMAMDAWGLPARISPALGRALWSASSMEP